MFAERVRRWERKGGKGDEDDGRSQGAVYMRVTVFGPNIRKRRLLYHVIAASDETLSQLIGSSPGRLAHCTVSHMPALERDFLRRAFVHINIWIS